MKKILWIVCLVSGIASAQDLDTLNLDTTEVEPPKHYLGVYFEGGMSYEPSAPNRNYVSIVGLGVQYNRWLLSFSVHDLQSTVQAFVIFPSRFELDNRYGGLNLGYIFYQDELFNVLGHASYFQGDMVWINEEDGQDFLRDEFAMWKVGLKVELAKVRFVKPNLSVGYQKMNDLNLSQLNAVDYTGLYFAVGVRIGYFNQ